MITHTFDFCLKFCHQTHFWPHPLPPTSLLCFSSEIDQTALTKKGGRFLESSQQSFLEESS